MKSFLKSIIIATTISLGLFIFSPSAKAQNVVPVYGYAWSDNIGWISMNCDNSQLQPGYSTYNCARVGGSDYGVKLDLDSGMMTGYAWSDNVGWMTFNPSSLTPITPLNRRSGVRVVGIQDQGQQFHEVNGWARFCSDFVGSRFPDSCSSSANSITAENGGWNGWVSMIGKTPSGTYGVIYDSTTGNFSGYAWSGTVNGLGSEVAGWIDFSRVATVPKIPTSYIPTIDLVANPQIISPGGYTNLKYSWTNPDNDALHRFTSCTAYSDQPSGMAGNGWEDGSSQTVPTTGSLSVSQNQWVVAPSTTYYLDCVNAEGVHAANHSNPNVQCNSNSLANLNATCPKVTVIVKPDGTNDILLEGTEGNQTPSSVWSSNFSLANPSSTITLRWSSPGTSWTSCRANQTSGAVTGANLWAVGSTLTLPNNSRSGISVPQNTSIYTITCTNPTGTYDSNEVIVTKSGNGSANLVLVAKLDGDPDGSYDSLITVPSGRNVTLHWESSSTIVPGSCSASSAPSGYWSGSLVEPDNLGVIGSAVRTGLDLNRSSNAVTTYTITCTAETFAGITQQISSSAMVIAMPPIVPSLSINGCVKDYNLPFSLNIVATNLQNTTCVLEQGFDAKDADTGDPAWMGTYVTNYSSSPDNHLVPNMLITAPTTFAVKCGALTESVTLSEDPTCNANNSNRNWFFRFFER